MIDIDNTHDLKAKIKVIGVGGGGGNAVDRMVIDAIPEVEFISANTDSKALAKSKAPIRIQLGEKLTRGLGAGSKPEIGRSAAEETRETLMNAIGADTDLLFITAGMGGGTGTGAAPVIASLAREMGILTIGIVTKPFEFEGRARMRNAEAGIEELKKHVDTIVVVPNERLDDIIDDDATIQEAFLIADDVLRQGVNGISGVILDDGLINLDFADVQTVLKDKGLAHMGVGRATGKNKTDLAARMALNSPLLETSTDGARFILIAFTGDDTMALKPLRKAAIDIQDSLNPNAVIIWGTTIDERFKDEVMVTIVATGIEDIDYEEYGIEDVTILGAEEAQPPVRQMQTATRAPEQAPAAYSDDDSPPEVKPAKTEVEIPTYDGPTFITIDENEGIKTPSFLREWKNNRPNR